jgi:hypothetical protein
MVNFLTICRDQNANKGRFVADGTRIGPPSAGRRRHPGKEKFSTDSTKTLPGEELREGLYHE